MTVSPTLDRGPGHDTQPLLPFADDDGPAAPRVVLSYGLGVDSTAILLRWIHEPASRDFALDEILVVTAMTGNEWAGTIALAEQHILPLLRAHSIRYAQVARASASQTDGIAILDDSLSPVRVHGQGAYTLGEELLTAGTIPQRGGARLCSAKAKGFPLDRFIATATAGRPFRHVMGFEANEERRAIRDATYNTGVRTGEYPLLDWGWDRQDCIDYIESLLGITWPKSACVYCPFAWTSAAGRIAATARFEAHPDEAAAAMLLEYVAVALNPTQTLTDLGPLWTLTGPAAAAAFTQHLESCEHAVYEVRRVFRAAADDPTKAANSARSVRALATGTRPQMIEQLAALAQAHQRAVEIDGPVQRVVILPRPQVYPGVEHLLVLAPAVVADKQLPHFEQWWDAAAPAAGNAPQLLLAS